MKAPIVALMLLGGCAAMPERDAAGTAAELAKALDGRVAGKPVQCVPVSQLHGPQIIGETLLYNDGGRLWRVDTVGGCPGLREDQIIITDVYGGQLCRNDRFRTVDRTASIPGPFCRLGDFTPYVRPKD